MEVTEDGKKKCTLYNKSHSCFEEVFGTKCPGIKFSDCISRHGSGHKIPRVCGNSKNTERCFDRIEGGGCPGQDEEVCVSIHQAIIPSNMPKIIPDTCHEEIYSEGCVNGDCAGDHHNEGCCVSLKGVGCETPKKCNLNGFNYGTDY